ncbi:MAG: hypothetical protein HOJ72_05150, partial [Flavobacterium sp.]|nr:hypothetical protein [Flavobacterium sp.]
MKKLGTLLLLFFALNSLAQIENNPAIISTSVEKISDTDYNLIFTVNILDEWHLYSQYNPEDASLPMEILAAKGATGFQLIGKATE